MCKGQALREGTFEHRDAAGGLISVCAGGMLRGRGAQQWKIQEAAITGEMLQVLSS